MNTYDPIADLTAAGADFERFTPAQRDVIAHLTEEEVGVIKSFEKRLADAAMSEQDVQAHIIVVGGFWF